MRRKAMIRNRRKVLLQLLMQLWERKRRTAELQATQKPCFQRIPNNPTKERLLFSDCSPVENDMLCKCPAFLFPSLFSNLADVRQEACHERKTTEHKEFNHLINN